MVNCTNLPPGRYTFEVRAANNAGVWSDRAAQLDFTVPALWYETVGFHIAALLTVLGLLGAGIRRLLRRHVLREARLQRLVDSRTLELQLLNERLSEASQDRKRTRLNSSHQCASRMNDSA